MQAGYEGLYQLYSSQCYCQPIEDLQGDTTTPFFVRDITCVGGN